ncbi:MAG: alpha/beta fold hydrolase [Pleurocapsa sp.]
MSHQIEAVWIDANPSFKRFNHKIVNYLSQKTAIAYWEYHQDSDETTGLDIALVLLQDYLKSVPHTVNLIGHSTGGLLALLYARKYPHKVKSLSLLGVGCYPAIDWQAHYYAMRKLLPCSQEIILTRMVQRLFGYQNQYNTKGLIEVLKQDLNTSPSAHSLYQEFTVVPGGVSMPLMICGSENDEIIDRHTLAGWLKYSKPEDVLWKCPQGHHFFHYFFPQNVSQQVIKFWQQIPQTTNSNTSELVVSQPCS